MIESSFDVDPVTVSDVIHHEEVFGYIKTKFQEEKVGVLKNLGTYGCGSITDGQLKLEVRIASFNITFQCNKGDLVHLIGKIDSQGKNLQLKNNIRNTETVFSISKN